MNDYVSISVLQKELSFEDELKNRLVSQREDIYASGATVLKSNWHWTNCIISM